MQRTCLLACALAVGLATGAAADLEATGVIAPGGGGRTSGGTLESAATLGAPLAGESAGGSVAEISWFWAAWFPGSVVAVGGPPPPPRVTRLHQNRPNPFNPHTRLHFELAGRSGERVQTAVEVFDVHGRLVSRLLDTSLAPGVYDLTWDGTDASGRPIASGIYYARLRAGAVRSHIQMIALK